MIAKCIKSEKEGRKIFYGAMISESVIALVWAAAGVAFYGTTQLLSDALANGASNVDVRSQPDLHYDGSGGLQAHSDNLVHLRRFVCRGTVRNLSGIPYPQAKDS